ncbi:MAG: hypothetical protein ACYTFY_07170 [Planctomycetota bacterium]|jgi:hypothetical protein
MKKKNKRKKNKKVSSPPEHKGHLSLLPKNRDLSLIILKGHLLLEEEINSLLESILNYPEAVSRTKLDFQQRLCLLHAVAKKSRSLSKEWNAIEKVNIIRNLLSYNLSDEDIEKLVASFLEEVSGIPDYPVGAKNAKTDSKLKKALAFLCTFITKLTE